MLFVFNPKAGKGRIKMHLLDIVDIFSSHDYEVIIRATQAPKDAYEKAKEYARSRNMSLSKMIEQYLDSTPDEFLKSSY